jgi:hypothetical protein
LRRLELLKYKFAYAEELEEDLAVVAVVADQQ